MTQGQRLKAGLSAFSLLSLVFLVNLFHLQPDKDAHAPRRIAFPGSTPAQDAAPVRTGSLADRAAGTRERAEPAAAASPKPQTDVAAAAPSGGGAELIRAVQRELEAQGYGAAGQTGDDDFVTRASIMAFEWDNGLPLTGQASEALLHQLILGSTPGGSPGARADVPPGPKAEEVIRTVQQSLDMLGSSGIRADGRIGDATSKAIRTFEARQKMTVTGRISGHLMARLLRLAGEGRLADYR